ncbi:MAG: hypothetical protein ABI580_07810 [Burkholderiaceae bacterium]
MAHALRWKQTYLPTRNGAITTIGAAARMIAEEQALALRAAEKAASPRQSVAELRAMYLPAGQPQQEENAGEQTTKSAR